MDEATEKSNVIEQVRILFQLLHATHHEYPNRELYLTQLVEWSKAFMDKSMPYNAVMIMIRERIEEVGKK